MPIPPKPVLRPRLRRALVLLLAVLLTAQTASRKAPMEIPAAEKPSVLLLFMPGIGQRLGRYGSRRSSNLDRLAREGRLFQRVYASYPAPEASRVSLMTGQRPETTGVFGPPPASALDGARPVQERFHAAGYRTIRLGPVFGGDLEAEERWDVAEDDGEAVGLRVADQLAANRDERFFMVATLGGATPEIPPPSAPPGGPTLPGVPAIAVVQGRSDHPGRTIHPAALPPEVRRALIATLDARVDRIDAEVGEILAALDRLGLRGRIVVVAVSDGGPDLGTHGALPRQDLLLDERLRTTLIVTSPGLVEPGVSTPALAELVDVYPTLLDLCGLVAPRRLDGVSLIGALREPWATGRRAALSVAERDAGYVGRSVRTRRYRYTEWPDGSEELYDHDVDPQEWSNLAVSDAAPKPILADLRGRLAAHEASPSAAPARPALVPAGSRRPNVLFILLDDLTVRLGSYGYADVKSPSIDRLARMGRRFDRAYAQVAMCSPSRTSLLTGWRPERVDLWTNALAPRSKVEGAQPLQELFRAHGYYTARIGKIYHGPWEDEFHWDLAESLPASPRSMASPEADEAEAEGAEDEASSSWWVVTDDSDRDEPDGIRARRVAELLGEQRSRPFFIGLGLAKPHLRWTAPRKYFDLYPPESIHLESVPQDDLADVPLIALTHHQPIASPGLTALGRGLGLDEASRRAALAAYYACVSFVDAQVGVVLEALDRHHLWSNTIVVLLSDHGYHLGEHRLWRKDTLFEAALRTPLIVVAPGLKRPGVAARDVVELLDVYPTLAELAGLGLPPGIDGRSLKPFLDDPEAQGPGEAFSFRGCTPPLLGRSVRTGRYRFTEWPDGSRELYDLSTDPDELTNLSADPGRAAVVRDMKRMLDANPAD
jgi:iduronate 2-sulfatase